MEAANSHRARTRRARLDADALARFARRTPEPLLRMAVAPGARGLVIREIFRQMPSRLKQSGALVDTVIRWDIREEGAERVDSWYLLFEDGRCRTTRRPPETNARTTLTVAPLDFLRLATGAANPMAMFQSGRIKIAGDLFFAAQLQSMFRIPAA